jgi:hypothetical protein
MRLFMILVIGALVLGGVYHTQVAAYLNHVFAGTQQQAGAAPPLNGLQQLGNATNGLMTRAAGALKH